MSVEVGPFQIKTARHPLKETCNKMRIIIDVDLTQAAKEKTANGLVAQGRRMATGSDGRYLLSIISGMITADSDAD